MAEHKPSRDAADVAKLVAAKLAAGGCDYAIGGAIALGYWAEPRGTMDVDFTLFLAPDKPGECVWLLQELGCELSVADALRSLNEHGFCRASFDGLRVDVFLPTIPFYEDARLRRRLVELGEQEILIWDAETLAVFKMMFFRSKDMVDVEQILRIQAAALDCDWIRERLIEIYGGRDPRISQWDQLVTERGTVSG
ncbi:MAG: hypothetical protein ABI614_05430 [Planctomycetota bacterium]